LEGSVIERIDVSYIYTHLMWGFVMTIYLNTVLFGLYSIWTDLKGYRGAKEDFIMALLVSLWVALAYGLWEVTENL
jgi:hypothetical protein